MEYYVTPFVTHRGGAREFNSLDKAAKELKDKLSELKANGHMLISIVAIETEHHDPPMTTLEDGFLIITEHDPHV